MLHSLFLCKILSSNFFLFLACRMMNLCFLLRQEGDIASEVLKMTG